LSITGLECGVIIGREKISALIGIMSERALEELSTTGSKVALGTEYSILYGLHSGKRAKHPEVMFDNDLVIAAVSASGLMISIGLSGSIFTRDKERLVRCYGPEITPQQVLGGSILPAPEMEELGIAIRNASRAALVAAFEPSGTLTENEESGEE
jgi:lipid-binding SYLF domain-containing protein